MKSNVLMLLIILSLIFSTELLAKKKFQPADLGDEKKKEEENNKEEPKKETKKAPAKKQTAKVPVGEIKEEVKKTDSQPKPEQKPEQNKKDDDKKHHPHQHNQATTTAPEVAPVVTPALSAPVVAPALPAPTEEKIEPKSGKPKEVPASIELAKKDIPFDFSGTVFDITTKTPIMGASIKTELMPYPARSDKQGVFKYIMKLKQGEHSVEISAKGYKSYSKKIVLKSSNSKIEFYLAQEKTQDNSYSSLETPSIPKAIVPVPAPAPQTAKKIDIIDDSRVFYFFYSESCPHCHQAMPFIAELEKKYPVIKFQKLEVSMVPENLEILKKKIKEVGIDESKLGVPLFVFQKEYLMGFKENSFEPKIIAMIDKKEPAAIPLATDVCVAPEIKKEAAAEKPEAILMPEKEKEEILSFEEIRYTPGVDVIPVSYKYHTGLVIGSSGDIKTVINGTPTPSLFHPINGKPYVFTKILKNGEVDKSGFATGESDVYGGLISGEINENYSDKMKVSTDINPSNLSAIAFLPTASGKIMFGLQSGLFSFYTKALYNEETFVIYPDYHDLFGAYIYEISKDNKITLFNVTSLSKTSFRENSGYDALILNRSLDADTTYSTTALSWDYKSSSLKNKAALSFGYSKLLYNMPANNDFDYTGYQFEVSDKVNYQISQSFKLIAGFSVAGESFKISNSNSDPGREGEFFAADALEDSSKSETAIFPTIYAAGELRFAGLTLIPGITYIPDSQTGVYGTEAIDPRLNVLYELNEHLELKAAAGFYSVRPKNEVAVEPWGTEELMPERTAQFMAGILGKATETLSISAEGYYKKLYNLISRAEGMPNSFENMGEGTIFGGDFIVSAKMSNEFKGYAGYGLAKSERKDSLGSESRPTDTDIPHHITLGATYNVGKAWVLGGRFNFRSGLTYTEITGNSYLADTSSYIPEYGKNNGSRLPARHELDLSIERKFEIFSLYADISGAYGLFHKNIVDKTYNKDYSDSADISTVPFMFLLGLKGDF